YAANARYQFKWKIELQTDLRYNWRQATDVFGQNRNVFIWNAWIGKKFWKNNNGELRFSINDILNQNIGFQRNASSNFISERTYSTLKRYWLVSFAWNFNKTPGSK
ncbi:MAG TPA: outer membrane beta-barrel protein, partial [Flavihumibacter sp.]|nr:outer membrane beta-barrel protein [Flavihumibacter sp.]